MSRDQELQAFVAKRRELMADIDTNRAEIDRWLDGHFSDGDAAVIDPLDLANLSGLIGMSRSALMELVKLDDSLLDHLLESIREPPEKDP